MKILLPIYEEFDFAFVSNRSKRAIPVDTYILTTIKSDLDIVYELYPIKQIQCFKLQPPMGTSENYAKLVTSLAFAISHFKVVVV